MSSDEEPQSIRSLFEDAEAKREALDAVADARSPAFAAALDAALRAQGALARAVAAAGLFSANEGVEDVATSSLPYLLVPFHAAELVQRTPAFTGAGAGAGSGAFVPGERLAVLERARAEYERFLRLADGYGLVTAPYDRLLERYRDDEGAFAVVAAGADAAAKRDGKIASFKAEKALRDKLDTLRRNPHYLDHGDEELVREVHLTHVLSCVHATFQALDSMNREVPLLASAPPPLPPSSSSSHNNNNNNDDNRDDNRRPAQDTTYRLDKPFLPSAGSTSSRPGPLLSTKGKPLQPFTLVGSRAELAASVFRPGHNLPTMSIDEYLDEEKRRGNILSGGTDPRPPEVDEDDERVADAATYKAREWDDFKDENRKGAGNTLNMG